MTLGPFGKVAHPAVSKAASETIGTAKDLDRMSFPFQSPFYVQDGGKSGSVCCGSTGIHA
jgi:hypothetical protein